ncbi:WD40-repeat-containing domain protein [Zychaea mexicana]|uniref:WD40-repeat-containing domain protein n=1 Tax=Zychaea mexicana TaxID=64656 RepID=UPI0022FE75B6|nr:WD40-repeat-containing domain protein [Zychaea mexicana]KAI9495493.1 WD40-repeat-containing domain protein [Zychaea mexicana]
MQDPFFSAPTTTRKRKRIGAASRSQNKTNTAAPKRSRQQQQQQRNGRKKHDSDVEENGDDDEGGIDTMNLSGGDSESSEEEIEETAAEKRVRLAKAYLGKIQEGLDEDLGGFDAADLDRDLIAERLKKDEDELEGRLHRRVADTFDYAAIDENSIQSKKGHQLAVTSVVFSESGSILYTASKDGSIVKWDMKTFKKLHTFPGGRKGVKEYVGHTDHILCMAMSSDGEYLATGGRDRIINVWSVQEDKHIIAFKQHKDTISGLAFRKGHHQLYSASWDRTIKLWNVDERAYMETLFGHQDQIGDIDTLGRERCVSVGGRDKTARMWKIVDQSQLVYRGGISSKEKKENGAPKFAEGSLDCIAQIDEKMFVTGGDGGVISLWDIGRKKPVYSISPAHGVNTTVSESEGEIDTAYWITAIASLRYSDLFVSGSWDGFVRLWKIAPDNKSFSQVGQVAVAGVVNSIEIKTVFPSNRTVIAVGVGQELKSGRWLRLKKGVKNCTKIIELPELATAKI